MIATSVLVPIAKPVPRPENAGRGDGQVAAVEEPEEVAAGQKAAINAMFALSVRLDVHGLQRRQRVIAGGGAGAMVGVADGRRLAGC